MKTLKTLLVSLTALSFVLQAGIATKALAATTPNTISRQVDMAITDLEDLTDDAENLEDDAKKFTTSTTQTQFDALEGDIMDIVDDAENTIDDIYPPVNNLERSELLDALDDLDSQIADVVDIIDDKVGTDLQDDVDTLDDDLNDSFSDLEDDIDALYQNNPSGNFSQAYNDVEDALDEMDSLSEDMSDLENDISTITTLTQYNNFTNGLMDIIDDIKREIRGLPNTLTTDHDRDIQDALDDLEDDANSFADKLKARATTLSLTPTPDYAGLYDDIDTDFEDMNDDLDEIQIVTSYGANVTNNQVLSATYLEDVLDELDDIQADAEDDIEDYVKSLASTNSIDATILAKLKKDINNSTDDTSDEIDSIRTNLKPVDIADLEDGVQDIEDTINDILDAIEGKLVSGITIIADYNKLEEDTGDDFDEIYDNIDELKYTAFGTSTSTNSNLISQVLDNFDNLMDDTEDLDDDYTIILTQTDLNNFEDDAFDIIDDAENTIQNIRSSVNRIEYDNIKNELDDLEDEINNILDDKTENFPTTNTTLNDNLDNLQEDIDNAFDDINDDLDGLLVNQGQTNYGSNPNIDRVLSNIDDYIDDVEKIEKDAKNATINDATELETFGDDLRDIISDVDNEISRLYGPLNRNTATDIEDAIEDFTDAVDDAMSQIAYNTTTNLQSQYNLLEDDVDEDLDDLDETVNDLSYLDGSPSDIPGNYSAFIDVTSQNVFRIYISNLAQKGIINGFGDRTFRPNNLVTRAEFLKIAINAAGIQVPQTTSSRYSDVYLNHSLLKYINYADTNGLLTPVSATKYAPDMPIRRIDAVSILLKLKNVQLEGAYSTRFTDLTTSSEIAIAETAANLGIVSGYNDGTFRPNFALSRGEASKIIAEAFNITGGSQYGSMNENTTYSPIEYSSYGYQY